MKTNSVYFFNETKSKSVCDKCQLILAAWELKNPGNIGHIIRLGHNVNAQKVLFAGNMENYRESKIRKTAGFSYDQLQWQMICTDDFFTIFSNNYAVVALETCEDSVSIFDTKLPEKIILLAGNESQGLPAEVIQQCRLKVHIPMPGRCKSMNISHALSVAAFEWYRQHST